MSRMRGKIIFNGDEDDFDALFEQACAYDEMMSEEVDTDVCQNCGGYFAWTDDLRAAWIKHWEPGKGERQPQRCLRCIVDETWVERIDE